MMLKSWKGLIMQVFTCMICELGFDSGRDESHQHSLKLERAIRIAF